MNKSLSEEDTKRLYITPALEKNWDKSSIVMEHYFTAGRIIVRGNGLPQKRQQGKKADYILYTQEYYPIAVVEAKSLSHSPSLGIQQAIDYASILDIPYAYSTNGKQFVEHDMTTGEERTIDMEEFPTPLALRERLMKAKSLTQEEETIVNFPYYTSSESYPPRYYQRIAINRTIEAVARGDKRILLVMATGTGKTYTAFQIIHRLHNSRAKKRILYLADRNVLIDQTMNNDFKPFRKTMCKVQGKEIKNGFEIYMSLYGQWVSMTLKKGKGNHTSNLRQTSST